MIQKIQQVNPTLNDDYIKWEPKFALGIGYIDEQHKHLVELCNKLYYEIMRNKENADGEWKDSVAGTLKECVDYVKVHFSCEEKLMLAVNYENYAGHKKRHDEFTQKVIETAGKFNTMTFVDAINLAKFLYDWILSHIAHEDKLYVAPIRAFKKAREESK